MQKKNNKKQDCGSCCEMTSLCVCPIPTSKLEGPVSSFYGCPSVEAGTVWDWGKRMVFKLWDQVNLQYFTFFRKDEYERKLTDPRTICDLQSSVYWDTWILEKQRF